MSDILTTSSSPLPSSIHLFLNPHTFCGSHPRQYSRNTQERPTNRWTLTWTSLSRKLPINSIRHQHIKTESLSRKDSVQIGCGSRCTTPLNAHHTFSSGLRNSLMTEECKRLGEDCREDLRKNLQVYHTNRNFDIE